MLRKLLLFTLLIGGLTFAMVSCFTSDHLSSNSQRRGNDPWVFRSVLDQKARMITIALRNDFWVAYDGTTTGIYKVWQDGVLFDGPVYTMAHGPQPESQGDAFFISTYEQPWRLVDHGDTITPEIQYLGHKYVGSRMEMNYRFSHKDQDIYVTESPEAMNNGDAYTLERSFTVAGLQSDQQLLLHSNAASLQSWPQAKGGRFELIEGDDFPVAGKNHSYTVDGMFKMITDGTASLSYSFHASPMVQKIVAEGPNIHPGLALIERSDCKSCHNEQVKTIGPAYISIAEKYPFSKAQLTALAQKIINGGSGVWGEQVMTAHPDLMENDAKTMVSYILSLDGEQAPEEEEKKENPMDQFVMDPDIEDQGILLNVYLYDAPLEGMPEIGELDNPVFSAPIPAVYAMSDADFQGLDQQFAFMLEGFIDIPEDNTYLFAITSDDGSMLYLDDKLVIDNDGFHGLETKEAEVWLTKGRHPIEMQYFQAGGGKGVALQWRKPGDTELSLIGPKYLSHDPEKIQEPGPPIKKSDLVRSVPGDTYPLTGVHPSFTLENIRPEFFEPKVGGMDFLDDDHLIVSTWDPRGSVWMLGNIKEGNPETVTVTRIADGLAEPLGVKVVDGDIYVLQKQELTQLIDNDGDGITDEYRTISNDWRVSANFHEFAFGLAYKDGWFYAALATAIEPGGASTNPQIQDRGKAIRINRITGELQFVAHGLRTPNGVGIGVDDELFIADNQGDWLPASKIVHVQKDAFYGSRSVNFEGTADLEVTLPVVWLPQDEIGNSPSQPIYIDKGPYAGQMLHGEVTHGGIKRVFAEKVDGQYQGAVFRFTQGLEAGVNRMAWGPDDKLYIGGVGNPGNWSHYGKYWYGLQRLAYNEQSTFEMLAIRASSEGIEVEFTEPVSPEAALNPDTWDIHQWKYVPTENYGGPKVNETILGIRSIRLSENKKRVFLELSGMKAEHLVYVHIATPFRSETGESLWTTEAWYNMNKIPSESRAFASAFDYSPQPINTLSEAEKNAGWRLLFDGESTQGWHKYNADGIGSAWRIENGLLTLNGEKEGWQFADGGDIVSDEEFEDFELVLEWRIEEGGNSGMMYFVQESPDLEYPWLTGPEMQILDNERHPDGRIEKHRAGDLYDLIESQFVTSYGPMKWNQVRLVVNKGKVEHWLNGYKVVEYDATSEEHQALINASKFSEMPGFGQYRRGRISLQDHGNRVWFRNIKIRPIGSEEIARG